MLTTARLLLRQWRNKDLPEFAALNADPRVMEYFPSSLTAAESDARAARIINQINEHGFGLWAVEAPDVADFIGFVGLNPTGFDAPFTPCVEVGWRLAYDYWGFGYATEAASAAIAHGFDRLALEEIVSFTTIANARSRRVMERLGMTHSTADDFDHPSLPEGHALRRHALYRLGRADWKSLHSYSEI
jgi:RimJ/RimL family protein N-acetyltransferase